MDAKRWSPLWVFVGGCLTGAAVIGFHSLGGAESPSRSPRAGGWGDVALWSLKAGEVEERADADSAAAEVAGRGEAPVTQSASEAASLTAASPTDTADRDKVEAGNSVAEVLARLETEYRERSAAAHAQAPALSGGAEVVPALPKEPAREQAQRALNEVSASKPPASEPPAAVRATAPVPEAPPADARLASSSAEDKPAAAAEEAARLASIRADQAKAFDSGQQQLAQMQQLAALQQATLVEQYTLLQLQLLSMSPAPRAPVPPRSQRRAKGGRIVASLPSSISDTDNPWGFDLQRSVLVR